MSRTATVRRAELRDFRNYDRADIDLSEAVTVISGPNGAGKTNLLEAIYFGLTGRSCRTSNEREIVRHGSSVTRVAVETHDDAGAHLIEAGFQPGEPKCLRVDGAAVERLGDSSARPLVSVFMPERLELVRGAPSARRAHLDQLVTALWPSRAPTRAAYTRALAQRNALLTRVRSGLAASALLDPWDAELARHGAQLMSDREGAVVAIAESFSTRSLELGLPEVAEVSYRRRSKALDAEGLRAELEASRATDLARGFSGHGPHRDELALRHDGRPLRAFGSQGQQRVALLALLLAERDALARLDRSPMMLLDDVMSELDSERRERLGALLDEGGQAVVTATDAERVPSAAAGALVSVRSGAVEAAPSELHA